MVIKEARVNTELLCQGSRREGIKEQYAIFNMNKLLWIKIYIKSITKG